MFVQVPVNWALVISHAFDPDWSVETRYSKSLGLRVMPAFV
jgi:hypothetical protein